MRATHYTISLFFSFTAFTLTDNPFKISTFPICLKKTAPDPSVKANFSIAFTHNSLQDRAIDRKVKA